MSHSEVKPYTRSDGTTVRGHSRRSAASKQSVDADAQQRAIAAAARQSASDTTDAEPLASNYIAEKLREFDTDAADLDPAWSVACKDYLRQHAMLKHRPDAHPTAILYGLSRMDYALERMHANDGGAQLPHEYYSEGIAHFQDELEDARRRSDSAEEVEDVYEPWLRELEGTRERSNSAGAPRTSRNPLSALRRVLTIRGRRAGRSAKD